MTPLARYAKSVRNRAYYLRNRDELLARRRAWYAANKERQAETQRERRARARL